MKPIQFILFFLLPFTLWSQQAVSLSDTTMTFGNVDAYEQHSISVTLFNHLTEPVQVTSVLFEENIFSTDLGTPDISAGGEITFHVYFESSHNLEYTDFLQIELEEGRYIVIAEVSVQCEYSDYYSTTQNLWGSGLKTALHNIINDHIDVGYTWFVFETSDIYNVDTVWDMYSFRADNSADYYYIIGEDQNTGGSTASEGLSYNREHSFPRSWFGGSIYPMNSDYFHIFPTDGHVNAERGSFPYGEVSSVTWESTNGSKVGPCSYPGYSGTVFEPIDAFKGDFARGHLYMATRYQDIIDSWESNTTESDAVLNGTEDQVFELWALQMLLNWHHADPVSQKERDRNTAVFAIQENRNPFVDHPEFADRIWNSDGIITYSADPEIAVSPLSANMGTVGLEQPVNFKIALINSGDAPLAVSAIVSTSSYFIPGFSEVIVPAESYVYLPVNFTSASSEGTYTTFLQISSEDEDEDLLEIPVTVVVDASVGIADRSGCIQTFILQDIYPNPFNPVTHVRFSTRENIPISADLYNLEGQKLKQLFAQHYQPGQYSVPVNLSDLPSGMYLLRLKAGNIFYSRKLVLLK